MKREWCEVCREHVSAEEIDLECVYPDCPVAGMRAMDVEGMHKVAQETSAKMEAALDPIKRLALRCGGSTQARLL